MNEHFRKLERMYAAAPTNAYYHPRLSISEGTAEVIIPIRSEFFHAAGAAHGSVYFKALDDSSFFAASSLEPEYFLVTVSYTLYFTRPVSGGEMIGRGRVVNRSKRLIIAESEVFDSDKRLVARGSGTFMPSSGRLSQEMGYC